MTYEVLNGIGNVVAVFEVKSMADEYAESKGYKVKECDTYTSYQLCDFSGFEEVEINGINYYQEGRM
jgi:hypothetical protein